MPRLGWQFTSSNLLELAKCKLRTHWHARSGTPLGENLLSQTARHGGVSRRKLPELLVEVDPKAADPWLQGHCIPVTARVRTPEAKARLKGPRRRSREEAEAHMAHHGPTLWPCCRSSSAKVPRGLAGTRGGWYETWREWPTPWLRLGVGTSTESVQNACRSCAAASRFVKEVTLSHTVPKMDHLCFDGRLVQWMPNTSSNALPLAQDVLPSGSHRASGLEQTAFQQAKRRGRDENLYRVAPECCQIFVRSICFLPTSLRRLVSTRASTARGTSVADVAFTFGPCGFLSRYWRTVSDLAPEITRFNALGLVDDLGSMHNILRPETFLRQLVQALVERAMNCFQDRESLCSLADVHSVFSSSASIQP